MSNHSWLADIPGVKDLRDVDGVVYPRRSELQILAEDGIGVVVDDDPVNDRTKITLSIDLTGSDVMPGKALPNTLFASSAAGATSPDGRIGLPFATLGAAITAAPTGTTILIDTGSYSGEALAWSTKALSLVSLRPAFHSPGTGGNVIASIAMSGGASARLVGIEVTGTIGGGELHLQDSKVGGAITGGGSAIADNSQLVSFAGTSLRARFCAISGSGTVLSLSALSALVLTSFTGSAPVIAFAAPGGIVAMDQFTMWSFLGQGGTVTNGRILLTDPDRTIDATLSGDANDWNPTGWSTARYVRVNPTGEFKLTGLSATDLVVPRKTLINVNATNTFRLQNEATASSAANRIACPAPNDIFVGPRYVQDVWYDATSSLWRPV